MSRRARTPSQKWRSVIDPRNPRRYASWVRACAGKNGAYLIRDRETHEILYAGESHTGRLDETLTRHFQDWTGKTAGVTFDRRDVEVRIKITRIGATAKKVQDAWIARFDPPQNIQGRPTEKDDDDGMAPDSTPF